MFVISYRFIANKKYLPVIFGHQTKNDFLVNNLNFSFGDFYDANQEIKKIVGKDKVLISGFHNLFYADFTYEHDSYSDNNYRYKYLLSDKVGETCPVDYRKVYENTTTRSLLCHTNK